VQLDEHGRTIDLLREHPEWAGAWFVIGADEFADFLSWKEPDEVLERTQLGVATRPGYPSGRIDEVLERLDQPERVHFFEIEPRPVASRDVRELAAAGAPLVGLVPDAVAELIRAEGLYAGKPGYTGTAPDEGHGRT
jgi:nicotinate-nucleotide adenylyltransferase